MQRIAFIPGIACHIFIALSIKYRKMDLRPTALIFMLLAILTFAITIILLIKI